MADFGGVDLDSINTDPKSVKGALASEMKQAKKIEDQQQASTTKYEAQTGAIKEKEDKLTDAATKPGGALMPPDLTTYKPPPPTDPWAQWGSPAMWLAGLSTFLGRRSLTRALDAGGAYLNASKANDDAKAKQAFENWKQENENSIKMHDWQVDAYKEAMKNLRDDKAGAREEVQTLAYSLAHDPMLQALEHGRESALSMYDTMVRHGDEMKRLQPEIEDHVFRQGLEKKVEQIQARRDQDLAKPGADAKAINAAATAAIGDLTDQANAYFAKGATGRSAGAAAKGGLDLSPAQIDALYDGRARMSDYGIRGANREAAMAQVTAVHPDFDTRLYDIRKGVMKGYMDPSGVANKNIVASNTAIGHVDQLRDLAEAIKNGPNQISNSIVNEVRTKMGHPEVTNAQLAMTAIGEEMMKSFRQVGASEKEAAEWKHNLNVAVQSPEQIDGVTKGAMEILMPRLDTLNENWKTDMGTDKDFVGLFTPRAKQVLDKLKIDYPGKVGPKEGGDDKSKKPDASKMSDEELLRALRAQ